MTEVLTPDIYMELTAAEKLIKGARVMFRALFDLKSDPDPHPNKNL